MLKKLATTLLLFVYGFSILKAQDNPVHWKFSSKKITDCEYDLVFTATIDEPWHIYSLNPSADGPNPTSFKFDKSKDFELVGKPKQSAPVKEFDKVFEMNVEYFHHTATFTQRVKLLAAKKITIAGKYEFQACTEEKCIFPPADEFSFDITGSATCAASTGAINTTATTSLTATNPVQSTAGCVCDTDAILKAKNTEGVAGVSPMKPTPAEQKVIDKIEKKAVVEKGGTIECNPWESFLLGLFGGLIALVSPCVYSMIPLTVSFFTKRSQNVKQGRKNAILYSSFIVIIYVVLGLLLYDVLNALATNAWINLAYAVIFLIFGFSFLGGFEITLPNKWVNKTDNASEKGGFIGIFFMAFTLVLVSFSCTGPALGSVIPLIGKGNILCPLLAFMGFGLMIALPFGLFAFFPGMLNSLPKSGGWLNVIKVSFGFLELALALKFLSNADLVYQLGFLKRELFIALWIAIFGLWALYLIGKLKFSHDSDMPYLSVTRLMFGIIVLSFTFYLIPGLWGAPLELIAGFPPPSTYSESPRGIGGHVQQVTGNTDEQLPPFAEVGEHGIIKFTNDYDHALEYAKKVGKPLMLDFTGHACVNCRKMEQEVWPKEEVLKRLKNDVVLVSLYVDDKRELPEAEKQEVEWYGKKRTLNTIGEKWGYFQSTRFNEASQPQYVLLDHAGNMLTQETAHYDSDVQKYVNWLDEGISAFKNQKH